MSDSRPQSSQQLFTEISSEGQLSVSCKTVAIPQPKPNEVIVKIEAAPINPSDMWPMFGPADLREASFDDENLILKAPVHKSMLMRIKSRLDQALPIGNEGAGTVVAAGDSPQAQALIGKTVGVLTGAVYTEYACVPIQACMLHNEGTTAKQAASSFVNPLTALSMVETMKREGHSALVHTAAASSLGIMLNKICLAEGIDIVNIVRKQEQVDMLSSLGAKHVLNSSAESFKMDLFNAINETGATLAFDAIGGGDVVSDILTAMEAVGSQDAVGFNTYGSEANKQVYIYGGLDFAPTVLNRAYGMTWNIGGWLLMRFLGSLDIKEVLALHKRVADEIDSTFASNFSKEISLKQALEIENVAEYMAKKTGEKYLINPSL
ncbi:zinc-binding dehydrogenase [Glaciecola petra]|uniref:Zinc-binding dehydrogenase n=1 Tax=Glaciecola petra TaxID=3075602 RepID=A0ABU2ZLP7_9ALTE|nr:zinc-binding dehydrogenase [Aestuariibacter sp. P117]MDT0593553.1 zinc-binding dehydrogenase [Aestuariibacter sp. P117]